MNLKPDWKVVLIEKGQRIEKRKCPLREGSPKCTNCRRCGLLCGWGGAGAFSDGKLNTLVKDKVTVCRYIYNMPELLAASDAENCLGILARAEA